MQDLHQFECWYVLFSNVDENVVYTCADDQRFKMVDMRTPIALQTNKKHDAGVTFLKEIDENKVLTGSYDCSLKTWDRRKLNTEIDSLYTERQIWDLKFNKYNDA